MNSVRSWDGAAELEEKAVPERNRRNIIRLPSPAVTTRAATKETEDVKWKEGERKENSSRTEKERNKESRIKKRKIRKQRKIDKGKI